MVFFSDNKSKRSFFHDLDASRFWIVGNPTTFGPHSEIDTIFICRLWRTVLLHQLINILVCYRKVCAKLQVGLKKMKLLIKGNLINGDVCNLLIQISVGDEIIHVINLKVLTISASSRMIPNLATLSARILCSCSEITDLRAIISLASNWDWK